MFSTATKTKYFIIGIVIILGAVITFFIGPSINQYFSSPIKINQVVFFNQHEIQNQTYLGKGWSQPEAWGVWMEGRSAKVTLPLPDQKVSRLKLILQAFTSAKMPAQELNLFINGVDSGPITIREGQYPFIANLEKIDLSKAQFLSVEFRPINPIKPKDLGLGQDERLLSVGLISAQFQ